MTARERAEEIKSQWLDTSWRHLSPVDAVMDDIERAITAAVEERDKDWSHALKQAVESQFPDWSDPHEWPASPDVEAVCAWLKRLVEAERGDCAEILALEAKRYGAEFPGPIARTVEGLLLTLAIKIRARSATSPEEEKTK